MRPHQPTPTPDMKGDNRRQRETRPLQSPRRRPHQPTPTPHIKGDNRRQWETMGDKTTSEPKKPTTPTNTKAARSKVALRTPTVNCSGKKKPPYSFSHWLLRHLWWFSLWWFFRRWIYWSTYECTTFRSHFGIFNAWWKGAWWLWPRQTEAQQRFR